MNQTGDNWLFVDEDHRPTQETTGCLLMKITVKHDELDRRQLVVC